MPGCLMRYSQHTLFKLGLFFLSSSNDAGHLLDRRRLEDRNDRQSHTEHLRYPARQPHPVQGVSAEFEEVVMAADALYMQQLTPDLRQCALKLPFRRLVP